MIEGLVIYFIGRNVVGKMAENKGYSAGLFTALFMILWFLGEIFGFAVGFASAGRGGDISVPYLIALMFAVGGAFLAFIITLILPDTRVEEEQFDRYGRPIPRRGSRRPARRRPPRRRPPEDYEDEDEETPPPRRRRREVDEDDEDDLPRRRRRSRDEDFLDDE